MAMVNRFDIYMVNVDPEPSRDAKNTRPCVVISPDEINHNLRSVLIAPLSTSAEYPTRIPVTFLNSPRSVVLDQIRTVDISRLVKKIGELDRPQELEVLRCLAEMFSE
jgi:mRNA interferase MazF